MDILKAIEQQWRSGEGCAVHAPQGPGERQVLAEHQDAVFDAMWPSTQDGPIHEAAHAILTTNDELAQQALAASLPDDVMMAELVKRGRLKLEWGTP